MLGEIDELTNASEWHYVPSRLNIADIATKVDSPPLNYSQAWFQGPAFLRQPEDQWPKDLKNAKVAEEATCEKRSVNMISTLEIHLPVPDEGRFSNWIRLVRTAARVIYFIKICRQKCQERKLNQRRKKSNKDTVHLDSAMMKMAEKHIIKKCQNDTFAAEIACLTQGKPLPSNSRLLKLTPYLDDDGILRVGGRIDQTAGVDLSTTRPPILDGKHRTTRLIVEYYHRRAMHVANEHVVNELRQSYWIVNLRPTVRSVAAQCLFCRYRRANPQPQRMGDLPAAHLQYSRRPFSYTGVDFFGPIETTIGRGRQKRYGMIFTCLTVRAIHIEITESLSTDSAIMALIRMAARRGTPLVLFSDNGTNLRGADNELKMSLK
ncbi:uncharacterized protein LOC125229255 isoform X1 [Leguminivora glycinivorella]|uniref:uncharacterized protein LOC125229255 isoform X1 n=1 Tax=Leguminivora glycinivorella TaxID=1035111 RepID=UPI00200CD72D|nr:uncharacterized protein LOC125229255 isoform X1 [Leguminivora glycinivorella]